MSLALKIGVFEITQINLFNHEPTLKRINPREMKKTLAQKLREHTNSIEFRAIRSNLYKNAQDKKYEFRKMHISPETIIMLQNEGIKVQLIKEFNYSVYKLSWFLLPEEELAGKIKWCVDFGEKHISVPQAELTEAENDSFVAELRTLGFHIQSAII